MNSPPTHAPSQASSPSHSGADLARQLSAVLLPLHSFLATHFPLLLRWLNPFWVKVDRMVSDLQHTLDLIAAGHFAQATPAARPSAPPKISAPRTAPAQVIPRAPRRATFKRAPAAPTPAAPSANPPRILFVRPVSAPTSPLPRAKHPAPAPNFSKSQQAPCAELRL